MGARLWLKEVTGRTNGSGRVDTPRVTYSEVFWCFWVGVASSPPCFNLLSTGILSSTPVNLGGTGHDFTVSWSTSVELFNLIPKLLDTSSNTCLVQAYQMKYSYNLCE